MLLLIYTINTNLAGKPRDHWTQGQFSLLKNRGQSGPENVKKVQSQTNKKHVYQIN